MLRIFCFFVALVLCVSAFALPRGGGTNNTGGGTNSQCITTAPPAPPGAAAQNYTCAIYDATFQTLTGNVDVNDTRATGYKLYVHNTWPGNGCWNHVLPASDFSIVSGQLFYAGDANNQGNCYGPQTAAYTSGTSYVGKAFKAGFYADLQGSYPAAGYGNANQWPAFWSWPVEQLLGVIPPNTYFTEIDFFEASGSPPTTVGAEHQWQTIVGAPDIVNTNYPITVTQDGALHHYGMLVRSIADGGVGFGLLARYFDDTLLSSNVCAYYADQYPSCPTSAGFAGEFSDVDKWHYNIIIGAGFTVNRLVVYCNPVNVTECQK